MILDRDRDMNLGTTKTILRFFDDFRPEYKIAFPHYDIHAPPHNPKTEARAALTTFSLGKINEVQFNTILKRYTMDFAPYIDQWLGKLFGITSNGTMLNKVLPHTIDVLITSVGRFGYYSKDPRGFTNTELEELRRRVLEADGNSLGSNTPDSVTVEVDIYHMKSLCVSERERPFPEDPRHRVIFLQTEWQDITAGKDEDLQFTTSRVLGRFAHALVHSVTRVVFETNLDSTDRTEMGEVLANVFGRKLCIAAGDSQAAVLAESSEVQVGGDQLDLALRFFRSKAKLGIL